MQVWRVPCGQWLLWGSNLGSSLRPKSPMVYLLISWVDIMSWPLMQPVPVREGLPSSGGRHDTIPLGHICWSLIWNKLCMVTGTPQFGILFPPCHNHMGSPYFEMGTVFLMCPPVTHNQKNRWVRKHAAPMCLLKRFPVNNINILHCDTLIFIKLLLRHCCPQFRIGSQY